MTEQREVYLDNSATTMVCEPAAQKVMEMMTQKYGNPSSLHSKGLEAEREVTAAREAVAAVLGVQPREIYFTSGGTESNNLALFGAAGARRRMGSRIVTTAVEHPSVLQTAVQLEKQGFEVIYLKPGKNGCIAEQAIMDAVNSNTVLVSMMCVNNEVGSFQPIDAARRVINLKKAPALLHVDAVQAFGKVPLKPAKMGIDLMSLSGHKIHAPKGIGALYVARTARILPHSFGGGQETNLRPGTESTPLIAGLGAAVQALPVITPEYNRIAALRSSAIEKLKKLKGVTINSMADSLPYILNFSVPGIRSETMLHHLASMGIYVSSGSACAKGRTSHVLEAMGLPPQRIVSAIRVSFSRYNTQEDVDALCEGVASGMAALVHS